MDNKLSELSKPVAYSLRFRNMNGEPDKTINANTTFSTLEKAKAYGLGSRYVTQEGGKIVSVRDPSQDPIVEPLYSQDYVSALLAELEASKKSNAFLKEQLAQLANFNPDWDMLEACRESWREVAAALKEAEAKLEAKDKRIAELESIRVDASQVFKEIGNELGCNPDNESIMMAIDELKATQVTGPLALIIKRAEEMERILEGITPEMIAGGWTAKGISDYAKSLEAKLSTPVRLLGEMLPHEWERAERQAAFEHRKIAWDARLAEDKKAILAAGFTFTVEGDE
ncbi:hypothetical protein [Serratia marcescens]|uniref:hypothetical protein n=1 Tax=Serratia marcescens TaxID=615 RepID=UPI0027E55902|nr:hypothetical protein [Serratia marcescens]MDH2270149.1 hypothetical protein [Serratia marcescens]MDH2278126.1 hypothetical protein [Serratia marcescens]